MLVRVLEKKHIPVLVLLFLHDTQSKMANAGSIGVSKKHTNINTNPFTLCLVFEKEILPSFHGYLVCFMFVSYNFSSAPTVNMSILQVVIFMCFLGPASSMFLLIVTVFQLYVHLNI